MQIPSNLGKIYIVKTLNQEKMLWIKVEEAISTSGLQHCKIKQVGKLERKNEKIEYFHPSLQ